MSAALAGRPPWPRLSGTTKRTLGRSLAYARKHGFLLEITGGNHLRFRLGAIVVHAPNSSRDRNIDTIVAGELRSAVRRAAGEVP